MSRRILPTATARRSAAVLWQAIARHPGILALTLLLNVAASTAAVAAPLLLGRIIDAVTTGGPTARGTVLALTAGLVGAALAAGVLLGFARRFTEQLGVTVAAGLREDVLEHALQLDPHVLEAAGSGDVTSRVTEDVEQINSSISLMARVVMALITVAVTAVGLLTLDWRLACAFAAVFPVHWIGIRFVLPVLAPRFAAERQSAAVRTQEILTTLDGAATVRAYAMVPRRVGIVEEASLDTNRKRLTALRASLTFDNLMNYAEAVGFTAILTAGFFLVRADIVTVGAVTAAALLFHRLFGPLGVLFMSFANVLRAAAALTRLVGVADLPLPTPSDRPFSPPLGVVVDRLSHHYPDGPTVLHDVSVAVPPGSSLAVVGESGAGKTTLAALIGGVFPAAAGQILLGADAVDDLDPRSVRRRVAVVTQEVHTFAGTLADDLRLARSEATDDDLAAALRAVGALDWVSALPEGLGTRVGTGGHPLTVDQAQQLALARIVLVAPPVVVLDEATAEAGSAGARALERSAEAVTAARTAIVVAHRLTQARACDVIAVMSGGRIVELGTHDDLVAARGHYAELWAAWSA
ncbi:MAG: ABC transporter ATP-binding protein [Tessaracoccus sp.]|uniref:ABC transporter ATP-binding protein n=1 Tax=Tessaracoccus sp. TaxID=1971211 RepID=UPI001EB11C48|nr:ABC transporter ATP-binding protein [Tessaracoccus sp.]MBK7819911.1 ABC transporter ATP-binding protein [Tessaracoccus sp.]